MENSIDEMSLEEMNNVEEMVELDILYNQEQIDYLLENLEKERIEIENGVTPNPHYTRVEGNLGGGARVRVSDKSRTICADLLIK